MTSTPAPFPDELREEIARLIDPKAWEKRAERLERAEHWSRNPAGLAHAATLREGNLTGAGEVVQDSLARARNTDPATAHDAAHALGARVLSVLQTQILSTLLMAPGGLTTWEISEATGIERDTVSPRIKPLVEMGLIHDSGQTRIPAGRTRAAIVWKLGKKPE